MLPPNKTKPSFINIKALFTKVNSSTLNVNADAPNIVDIGVAKRKSISDAERERIVERIGQTQVQQKAQHNFLQQYMVPVAKNIAKNKFDNEMIKRIAPEINMAAAIVIPSIISPNDLRDNQISIVSESKHITQDLNTKISAMLEEHFNNDLKLSDKIPDWLYDMLYSTGAHPVMILPVSELDQMINDPEALVPGTESFRNFKNLSIDHLRPIFGIGDPSPLDDHQVDTLSTRITPAIESIVDQYVSEATDIDGKDSKIASYNRSKAKKDTALPEHLKKFVKAAIENMSIADNPDVLKINKAKQQNAVDAITDKLKKVYRYKEAPFVSLGHGNTKKDVNHPVFIELPTESVIPIFVPGSPNDHIGYFVLIDEFGNPIRSDLDNTPKTTQSQSLTESLYTAFGFPQDSIVSQNKRVQTSLMSDVYQQIITNHIKQRLESNGLINTDIGTDNSIYRCMFQRLLSAKKTRLLFVPRELLTYFCFKHNEDGTGRSKLEDIKFILSLKMTVLICRYLSQMNMAVNRRTIELTIPDVVADPIAYIEAIKRNVIDKSMVNFSWNPQDITTDLAQRSISVKAKGIAGAGDFEIINEQNQYQENTPDDGLSESLDKLIVLTLEVPPAAMNNLSENEYSRSVATVNIFFGRNMAKHQKIFCGHATSLIRNYTLLSTPLRDKIKELLSGNDDINNLDNQTQTITKSNVETPLQTVIDKLTGDDKEQSSTDTETPLQSTIDKLKSVATEDIDPNTTPLQGTIDKLSEIASDNVQDDKSSFSEQTPVRQKIEVTDQLIDDIISNIVTTLPSPNVAPEKAQFEDIDNFITSINNIIDSVFSDDLTGDDPVKVISASVKAEIIREHLNKVGFSTDITIPSFDDIPKHKILQDILSIANAKQAVDSQKKFTTATFDTRSSF